MTSDNVPDSIQMMTSARYSVISANWVENMTRSLPRTGVMGHLW